MMAGVLPIVHRIAPVGDVAFTNRSAIVKFAWPASITAPLTVLTPMRADAVFTPDVIHVYVPVVPRARFGRRRTEKERTGPGADVGSIVTHDVA